MLEKESSPRSSSQTEETHVFPDVETINEHCIDGKIEIMEFMEHGTNSMEIGVDIALEKPKQITCNVCQQMLLIVVIVIERSKSVVNN